MSALASGVHAVPHDQVRARWALAERHDLWLAGVAALLAGLGLVMVASSSVAIAERQFADPLFYFRRQAVYLLVAVLAAWGALRLPVRFWERAGVVLLLGGAVLLGLVLVPGVGKSVNGSMRWIAAGPVSIQPSELMKLFLVVYLAGYLVRRAAEVRSVWKGFVRPLVMLGAIAVLLLLEPDYGATVVLFAAALGMLFLGGVPFASFAAWALAVSAALAAVVVTAPYRLERLLTFLDPWADPFGSGFQLTQALIGIGRGDWLGVGLGAGIQKLFYLPEAHTDFLFAVLAEELGLAGAAAVICLFAFLVWRAFHIAKRAGNAGRPFAAYLAYGLGLVLGLQAFINIGVNLGVLPTKGLTLPLMSYGGSSLVANALAVGMLLRIEHETRTAP